MKSVIPYITAGALAISGCSYKPEPNEVAKVTNFVLSSSSPTSIANFSEGREKGGPCNYAIVEVRPGNEYKAALEHCIIGAKKLGGREDVVHLATNLTTLAQQLNNNPEAGVTRHVDHTPMKVPLSPYNADYLDGKELTVVGCFVDNTLWCYEITGTVTKPIGKNSLFMFISHEDYARIYRHNTWQTRNGLQSISNSPVFYRGEYVGAVSTGSSYGKPFGIPGLKIDAGFIGIQPVRDEQGKIHLAN